MSSCSLEPLPRDKTTMLSALQTTAGASCVRVPALRPLVSPTCCRMATVLQIFKHRFHGEAQRRWLLRNLSQVIVAQPHSVCTNPETLKDLMSRL
jgi:hypothetical protein